MLLCRSLHLRRLRALRQHHGSFFRNHRAFEELRVPRGPVRGGCQTIPSSPRPGRMRVTGGLL